MRTLITILAIAIFVLGVGYLFRGFFASKWNQFRGSDPEESFVARTTPTPSLKPTTTPAVTASPRASATPTPAPGSSPFPSIAELDALNGKTAPGDLPNSGPVENALIAVGLSGAGAASLYYYDLKRKLKKSSRGIEVL